MAILDDGLSLITVKKDVLISRLEMNRSNHMDAYADAVKAHRIAATKRLHEMLEAAKSGGEIERDTCLDAPVSHEDEYSRVLDMLHMSTKTEITISEQEFRRYARDEWSWKANFNSTRMSYGS